MTAPRPAPAVSAPVPKARVEWVDAAKGLSILLVVLFHATLVDGTPPDSGPWWVINAVFSTLRMPLFFLAAGLFAASALRRTWPDLLRGRVLLLVYLYVLWVTLRQLVLGLVEGSLDLTWRSFLVPESHMWFLAVLAVFFVAARALRPVPVPVQLGAAALVSIVVSSSEIDLSRLDEILTYLVFFLAGCHWSRPIRDRATQVTWLRAAVAWAVFLVATVAVTAAGLRAVPPFRFLLSVAAVVAGIGLAVLLARHAVGRPLVALGRVTLPVYVLHGLFITASVRVLSGLGWDAQATLVGPLLLAAFALGASLAVHRLLRGVPGLFETPAWLRRAVSGGATRPSTPAPGADGAPARRGTGTPQPSAGSARRPGPPRAG